MEDDDWLDTSPGPSHRQGSAADPIVEQEYRKIASKYSDAGYREGITDGKLSTLQEGFDQSFAASVASSRRMGRLRGRANALLGHLTGSGPGARAYTTRSASPAHSSLSVPLRSNRAASSVSSPPSLADPQLVSDLRDLIRDLGRVRRADVLPPDLEMEAHEREAHGTGAGKQDEGYELDYTEAREMEGLEDALAGLGGAQEAGGTGATGCSDGVLREVALLDSLEQRLDELIRRALQARQYYNESAGM